MLIMYHFDGWASLITAEKSRIGLCDKYFVMPASVKANGEWRSWQQIPYNCSFPQYCAVGATKNPNYGASPSRKDTDLFNLDGVEVDYSGARLRFLVCWGIFHILSSENSNVPIGHEL